MDANEASFIGGDDDAGQQHRLRSSMSFPTRCVSTSNDESNRRRIATTPSGTTLVAPVAGYFEIVVNPLSEQEISQYLMDDSMEQPNVPPPFIERSNQMMRMEHNIVGETLVADELVHLNGTAAKVVSVNQENLANAHQIVNGMTMSESASEVQNAAAVPMEVDDAATSAVDAAAADENIEEHFVRNADGDLVGAILASIGELPVVEENTNSEGQPIERKRYIHREASFDDNVADCFVSINDGHAKEAVKALRQDRINTAFGGDFAPKTQQSAVLSNDTVSEAVAVPPDDTVSSPQELGSKSTAAENADQTLTPPDDSKPYVINPRRRAASKSSTSTPVKQQRNDRPSGPIMRLKTSKCRYCGGNLRAVDKHYDDHKFALECRNRKCLRFNGFINDTKAIQSLRQKKSDYGWYLSNPTRIYYDIRNDDQNSDDDEPLPRKVLAADQAITVRCPGQKKLCMLI